MNAKTPICPSCFRPGGALTAKLHCRSHTCTWNKCNCGTTYDRTTLAGFGNDPKPVHYPAPKAGEPEPTDNR